MAGKRISELKMGLLRVPNIKNTGIKEKKNEQIFRDLWETMKYNYIYIKLQRKKTEKDRKKYLKK